MFHKIDPPNYTLVQPLLDEMLDIHLSILSLLERLSPGAIFVDDLDDPNSVFGYSMRRFFLAGSPKNDEFNQGVKDFFNDTLYPNATELKMPYYAVHFSTLDWDDVIPEILAGTNPVKEGRHYYNLKTSQLKLGWRSLIPKGYSLQAVDRSLIEQTHLQNLAALKDEMQSERRSVEDFLDNSFGFCLVREGAEIVAWCMSEYNCAGRCEVGIETLEDYQRRGFATITASAVVDHALSEGISEVGWHCYASNQPSIATALKVGFEKVCEYTEYWALTDKAMQMAIKGN
jgi:GNAT superfamily N-acetyltransferase